jgi:hypothetical protein
LISRNKRLFKKSRQLHYLASQIRRLSYWISSSFLENHIKVCRILHNNLWTERIKIDIKTKNISQIPIHMLRVAKMQRKIYIDNASSTIFIILFPQNLV